jgi:predicted transposase/invertase (TIGR01784 family)
MSKKIHNPHDAYFKKALQNPICARHFLERFLSRDMIENFQLDTLKIEPTEFIDDELKKSASDILFRFLHKKGKPIYVYVQLEHQRQPERLLAFRVLKYKVRIIDYHLVTHQTEPLPIVIPLVIYNGETAYPYSTDLWDLF